MFSYFSEVQQFFGQCWADNFKAGLICDKYGEPIFDVGPTLKMN